MAMLPFCGYNMADYWNHWLEVGAAAKDPPSVFQVNWFRQDSDGHFIWPGFGENMRVLRWVYERVRGKGTGDHARETAVGVVPSPAAIGASELGLSDSVAEQLFEVDRAAWENEARSAVGVFAAVW